MILQFRVIAIFVLFIPISFIIISLGFFVFFLRNYFKTKYKIYGYLTVFLTTYLLQNIFQIGEIGLQAMEIATVCFILQEIFNMLVMYSMVVLLEVFEKDVSFSKRQSILTILVFAAIGGMITTPTFAIDESLLFPIDFGENELIFYIEILFYVIGGIWLILMLFRSYKSAWSTKQKRIILWLSWGVFFAIFFPLIAYIFVIIISIISPLFLLITLLIFLFLRNLGVIFIGVAFFRASKEPWLLQRHRVHFLIVYSKDGIQLFSKVFSKSLSSERTSLLAGGFSAVTSLFREATETTGTIKSILLEDKELRIIDKPHFLCTILVDFSTQASEIAHQNFAEEFQSTFREELEQFDGEISIFEKAEEIVKKYFS